jgi:hypothetical protein
MAQAPTKSTTAQVNNAINASDVKGVCWKSE